MSQAYIKINCMDAWLNPDVKHPRTYLLSRQLKHMYICVTIVCKGFDGKKVLRFSQTAKIKHTKFFHIDY